MSPEPIDPETAVELYLADRENEVTAAMHQVHALFITQSDERPSLNNK